MSKASEERAVFNNETHQRARNAETRGKARAYDKTLRCGFLADEIKNWVTNELAPDLGATFAADLLGYALGEVDWYEIAAEADDLAYFESLR